MRLALFDPMSGIEPRLRFSRTMPSNHAGHWVGSLTRSMPCVESRMYRSTSACFSRRCLGSFGLPMSRKKKTPRNGMKKMARSQAMPAVGRRLRGTTMTAMMRTTRSMASRTPAMMRLTCSPVSCIGG